MTPKKRRDGVWREPGAESESWDPLVRESEDPDELVPVEPPEPEMPKTPRKGKLKR